MTLQKQLLAQLAISVDEGKRNPVDAIDVAHRDMVQLDLVILMVFSNLCDSVVAFYDSPVLLYQNLQGTY